MGVSVGQPASTLLACCSSTTPVLSGRLCGIPHKGVSRPCPWAASRPGSQRFQRDLEALVSPAALLLPMRCEPGRLAVGHRRMLSILGGSAEIRRCCAEVISPLPNKVAIFGSSQITTSRRGRGPRCSECGAQAARRDDRATPPSPERMTRAGRAVLSPA